MQNIIHPHPLTYSDMFKNVDICTNYFYLHVYLTQRDQNMVLMHFESKNQDSFCYKTHF